MDPTAQVSPYLKTEYSENNVNNLKLDVNPVFRLIRWENEIWSQKNLLPVLQLATLMLDSPASQRFIYSLIVTDSHHLMNIVQGEPGRFNCHFRKSTAPDDVVQARVELALEEVRKIVIYRFYPKLKDVAPPTIAKTNIERDGPLGAVITLCRIAIKSRVFRDTYSTATRLLGKTEVNRLRFMLATTLCHEVIHAIDGTVPEQCNQETGTPVWHHYEHQTESEVGYAWEMEVLGAIRIGIKPPVDLPVLEALPSLEQSFEELDFDSEQHTCVVRPTTSVADYMTRLQQQEFWDTSPRTVTMLRLPTEPDLFLARPILRYQNSPTQRRALLTKRRRTAAVIRNVCRFP
ncbi:MAG: hypothetical protein Q9226_004291 [Calogaya cf. arnoldii]